MVSGRRKSRKDKELPGIVLTDRDSATLDALARYRLVSFAQIQWWWSRMAGRTDDELLARQNVHHRLNLLEDHGYVKSHRFDSDSTRFYSPKPVAIELTRPGLAVVNTVSSSTIGHTLIATEIGLRYEVDGHVVVTERQMRAVDQKPDAPGHAGGGATGEQLAWAVREASTGGAVTARWPDLVIDCGGWGHDIAIEVELTEKAPADYDRKMAAYASGRYAEVWYFTPHRTLEAKLAAAARGHGMDSRLHVRDPRPRSRIPGYDVFMSARRSESTATRRPSADTGAGQ